MYFSPPRKAAYQTVFHLFRRYMGYNNGVQSHYFLYVALGVCKAVSYLLIQPQFADISRFGR